jgi:hypothetical protein
MVEASMRRGLISSFAHQGNGVSNVSNPAWHDLRSRHGALSAASMIPLSFSDKTAALTGAFLNRFAIGFVIGAARLPLPSWAQGLIFGILLSLPDAIITKTYAPILILGAVGGVVIGLIVGKWGV